MKHTIGSIFLVLTLLFSMTEISKVALLGYTLFTDGEKAAHFCTCMGCSHSDDGEAEYCDMQMNKDSESSHGSEDEPDHCDMNSTASGESVCGCDSEPSGEMHILFNTLDKTALLAFSKDIFRISDKRFFNFLKHSDLSYYQKDIFHPPKA